MVESPRDKAVSPKVAAAIGAKFVDEEPQGLAALFADTEPPLTLVNVLYANFPIDIDILVNHAPKDRTIIEIAEGVGLELEDEVDWGLEGEEGLPERYLQELSRKFATRVIEALRKVGVEVVEFQKQEIEI